MLFRQAVGTAAGAALLLLLAPSAVALSASSEEVTVNPTGTVAFFDGTVQIGTTQLVTNGVGNKGVATLTYSALPLGTHSITAKYIPSGSFGASSSTAVSYIIGNPTTTPGHLRSAFSSGNAQIGSESARSNGAAETKRPYS